MTRATLTPLLALALLACGGDAGERGVVTKVASPAGWCEASIVEHESEDTQVMVNFENGKCLVPSVRSPGTRLGLRIFWIDDTTLEVTYPPGVLLNRPDARIQCQDREVRLVLAKAGERSNEP
ncbi:MAG TPA: hypothetical protein VMR50_03530 [Myxococcota bacterium]|nr:hypothetical protein [Myxococcota bacterium]